MRARLVLLLFFSPCFANAYSKVKAVVQFPDNEEKTYAFAPTKEQPRTKIETKSDYGCLLSGMFIEDKANFIGVSVICFNLKANSSIESTHLCDSVGGIIITTPKSKTNKNFKLTRIVLTCE